MKRSLLIATAISALIAGSGIAAAQSASAPQPQTKMTQGSSDQNIKGTAGKSMKRTSSKAMHKRSGKVYGQQSGGSTLNNAPLGSAPQAADTIKEAPRTGDTSKIGATPNANRQMTTGQNASPAQNLSTSGQATSQSMSQ